MHSSIKQSYSNLADAGHVAFGLDLEESLIARFRALKVQCEHRRHRGRIIIGGAPDWCLARAQQVVQALCTDEIQEGAHQKTSLEARPTPSILAINAQELDNKEALLHTRQATQHLGQEYQAVIWNAHAGLDPNGFGAASGLIKAGGLLIVLLPSLTEFASTIDPDYRRMCADDAIYSACSSYFHQHFLEAMLSGDLLELWLETPEVDELHTTSKERISDFTITTGSIAKLPDTSETLAHSTNSALKHQLSDDQALAFEAIERVVTGHRKRPLVITADRGRGKTSILGIASAHLVKTRQTKVLITAPNKAAVNAALAAYDFEAPSIKDNSSNGNSPNAGLYYYPPDELLRSDIQGDVLLVDEAAGLPVPCLTGLLERYSRIVFSSTIHGYEGAGQGFSVRFKKVLCRLRPQWRTLHLTTPIRWNEYDPLEQATNQALCLDAELPELEPLATSSCADETLVAGSSLKLEWVDSETLARHPHLLKHVMALLTLAHYQTSPSDLRLLLDHPHTRLLITQDNEYIKGLVFCVIEPELSTSVKSMEALANDISSNKRRLRGSLVAQSLATSYHTPEVLTQSGLRVVRITCHPNFQRRGLGAALIKESLRFAKDELALDYVSVSYGLTPELFQFWHKQGFMQLKLGYQKDQSSGVFAAITTKPLSKPSQTLHAELLNEFQARLRFGLSRYYQSIDWQDLLCLLSQFKWPDLINAHAERSLNDFAYGLRAEYDAQLDLADYLLSTQGCLALQNLNPNHQALLIRRVLQNHSWEHCVGEFGLKGKKQGLSELRQACSALISGQDANQRK